MKYFVLLSCLLILSTLSGPAQDTQTPKPWTEGSVPFESFQSWHSDSPNGKFFSAIRRIPTEDLIWKEDLDGMRLVVSTHIKGAPGENIFSIEIDGRVPAVIKWTEDSHYLIFTTVSSGGHSPWHFGTYVFGVAERRMTEADKQMGAVVAPEFELKFPHTATFLVGNYEHPSAKTVDVSSLFKSK